MGDAEPVIAKLKVDASILPVVLADLPDLPDAAERHPIADAGSDVDSFVVPVEVRHRSAFVGWVLEFGAHVEVLSPPDLRAAVVDWLGSLADDEPGSVG
jgi:predicted DNA-binding transcriptional regulator YafY